MKRSLSIVSLVMGVCIVTPSLAYFAVPGNDAVGTISRVSRRRVVDRAESANKLDEVISIEDRTRGEAVDQTTEGYTLLRRAEGRRLRRYNRMRKPGADRYRTLNLRTNRRSLRGMEYESSLELPRTLVQTGGYSRPSRRSIRNDRDIILLQYMNAR